MKFILSLVIIFLVSCGSPSDRKQTRVNFDSLREPLINANKLSVKRESDEIDQYARFRGWDMTLTGTGLRYMIYKHGEGALAKKGDLAKIKFKTSLLDGTLCYSSETKGAKLFTIGADPIESGLHEAVQYMHAGDKAIIILPSHLAFGLTGDGDKIPARASVVYDIELLSLR
jgi:FKBP-type peptidyl-prolyl cis-trans isomerase FkpA